MNKVESFLTEIEERSIIKAIQKAEKNTSGEIRVHIENKSDKPTLERATRVFFDLEMDKTKNRNAILLYVGVTSKQFAIIGDEGIDKVVHNDFWEKEKELIINHFSKGNIAEGLIKGIAKVGEKLKEFFPYQSDDINELSDKISKG